MAHYTERLQYLLLVGLVLLSLSGLSAGEAYGQSSASFRIEQSVLDAGGGERNSDNFSLCDSLGQTSGTGTSSSSNYQHTPGFYACEAGAVDIQKTVDRDSVYQGESIFYELTIANTFDTAIDVTVGDSLDDRVSYQAGSLVGADETLFDTGFNTLLTAGQVLQISFEVLVAVDAVVDSAIANQAWVQALGFDKVWSQVVSTVVERHPDAAVPEPGTIVLFGLGLLGLLAGLWRKRS